MTKRTMGKKMMMRMMRMKMRKMKRTRMRRKRTRNTAGGGAVDADARVRILTDTAEQTFDVWLQSCVVFSRFRSDVRDKVDLGNQLSPDGSC
eukprot:COSAG02_NODE_812_length_16908_cov_238.494319_10_plen_92_part_00